MNLHSENLHCTSSNFKLPPATCLQLLWRNMFFGRPSVPRALLGNNGRYAVEILMHSYVDHWIDSHYYCDLSGVDVRKLGCTERSYNIARNGRNNGHSNVSMWFTVVGNSTFFTLCTREHKLMEREKPHLFDTAKMHAIFFKLAKYGNVEELKRKLNVLRLTAYQLRAAVNFVDKENACFVTAARNGHIQMVKFLYDHCHADVEQRGSVTFEKDKVESVTALWAAAAAGHRSTIEYLVLECGANVNSQTSTNSTPLRAASYEGNVKIVQFLVKNGAHVDATNKHGHTSLMIASYRGNVGVVRFLVDEGGADVNRKSSRGNTALHDAAESNHFDVMCVLLERGALLQCDLFNLNPLMSAASLGHCELVLELCHTIHRYPQCQHVDEAQLIAAYELLGAAMVDKNRNLIRAQQVWEESLCMRQKAERVAALCDIIEFDTSSSPAHTRPSLWPKFVPETRLSGIFHADEFCNEADLQGVSFDSELAAAQAVLVRTRLLGAHHPETCYHLRFLGAAFADRGNMANCVCVWDYVLDELSEHSEPLNAMLVSTFMSFMELFVLRSEQDSDDEDYGPDDLSLHLNDKVCMQLLRRACKEVLRGQQRLDKLKPLVDGRASIAPCDKSFSATAKNAETTLSSSSSSATRPLTMVWHRQYSIPSASDDIHFDTSSATLSRSLPSASSYEQPQRSGRRPITMSTSCKCDVVCNCAEIAEAAAATASAISPDETFSDENGTVEYADLTARLARVDMQAAASDEPERAFVTSASVASQIRTTDAANGEREVHEELLELDCERGNDLFKICDSCLMSPDFLEIQAAPTIAMQHKLLYERYQKDLTSMSRLMSATIYFADLLLTHFDTALNDAERREFVMLMRPLVHQNVRGREGRTVMHHAVTKNKAMLEAHIPPTFSVAVLGFLVALGAQVDAADDHGSTPLCLSSQERPMNESIVMTLINLGAHICQANSDRLSALRFLRAKPKLLYMPDCFPSLKCLAATKACELLTLDQIYKRADSVHMPTRIRKFLFSH